MPSPAGSLVPLDTSGPEADMALPTTADSEVPVSSPKAKSKDKKPEQAKNPQTSSKKVEDSSKHSWTKVKNANKVAADSEAALNAPPTEKPVDLDKPVEAGAQATMSITRIAKTRGEGKGIGEVAGPATLLEIVVENESNEKLDLQHAQIRLYYGKRREPAALLSDPRTLQLPVQLAAGKSVEASYVFSAPDQSDQQVVIEFETGGTSQIQQLAGQVTS